MKASDTPYYIVISSLPQRLSVSEEVLVLLDKGPCDILSAVHTLSDAYDALSHFW